MNVALLKYNNYYNRLLKREADISGYENSGDILNTFSNINFNPNDGLWTELVVNHDGEAPDYLVHFDDIGEIISRWFVMEAKRTMAMQYHLTLLRDAIAEWYDDIIKAPCFIEKGYINNVGDPAIFNNENMTYNQIKKSEQLIKDASGASWYVGYLARNAGEISVTVPKNPERIAGTFPTLEEYTYKDFIDTPFKGRYQDTTVYKVFSKKWGPDVTTYIQFGWDYKGNIYAPRVNASPTAAGWSRSLGATSGIWLNNNITADEAVIKLQNALQQNPKNWSQFADTFSGAHTAEEVETFLLERGKWYRIGDKVYQVNISEELVYDETAITPSNHVLNTQFMSIISASGAFNENANIEYPIAAIEYGLKEYTISLEEMVDEVITVTIPQNRAHASDAPYDLFAIPATELEITSYANKTNPVLSDAIVQEIIREAASNLYDVQKVPYAPLERTCFPFGRLDLSKLTNTEANTYYTMVSSGASVVIYPTKTSFTTYASFPKISVPDTPIDFKINNETVRCRLCSPNYNGQFEFSPAKNGGVDAWVLMYTYKPYSPYIRVAPQFRSLYGREYSDARGLVCGGDFSVSQISSAWETYQINNKNFQAIFDRQVENMEINNSVQRTMDIANAITGTAAGAVGGAVAGGATANPIGAVGGAIIGGVASAAGGVADVMLSEKLRNESIDYTKDQFGYQMGNIRALPYSLTKVGVQNASYKEFPFVETYECDSLEAVALRDKITYNGMTVMRIGQIGQYLNPDPTIRTYIKCKLIRLESIYDDTHILNHIASELNKGVYV